jgi:hypothetical protein
MANIDILGNISLKKKLTPNAVASGSGLNVFFVCEPVS